jgi:hypothetical protein
LLFRAWIEPARAGNAVLFLTSIRRATKVDKKRAFFVDHKRMHRVVTCQGKAGNHDSSRITGRRSRYKLVTEDSIVLFRIETAIIESDTAPTGPTLLNGHTEAPDDISTTGAFGVFQRQQEAARWWR